MYIVRSKLVEAEKGLNKDSKRRENFLSKVIQEHLQFNALRSLMIFAKNLSFNLQNPFEICSLA